MTTVAVLSVSALLSAWAAGLASRCVSLCAHHTRIACLTVHYFFGAIAIGAGIQLLFRG